MEVPRKQVNSTVTPVGYSPVNFSIRNPWDPSVLKRIPWKGFGAMLGAVAGIAAAVAVLVVSDGQPTTKWSLQPAVYLAICSALTNIFIHFALGKAVTVAWWRRATQPNTTIADLHRCWSYGDSLWEAVLSGTHVNLIAIASILVAIVPINGPFLQRASRVQLGTFSHTSNVNVQVAQSLPYGYTGYLSGRQEAPTLLTPPFTKVVEAATSQAPINVTATGCTGKCATIVRGAGFAINCSTTTAPFGLTPTAPQDGGTFDTDQEAVENGTRAFGSSFLWSSQEPATVNLTVQYKDTTSCDGNLVLRNCTLMAATVDYPVIVNGNQSTIELDPDSTMFTDHIYNMTSLPYIYTGPTTLGGFYKALRDTYESTANLRFVGALGYELSGDGATANRYAVVNLDPNQMDAGPQSSCNLSFSDPTDDLVRSARDLMFRSAVAAANATNAQHVSAQETRTVPTYESRYLYLGIAVLFTAIAWLATLPIFIGWWHVGRTVSMSPIETAKAFRAPMLQNADPNAMADEFVKEVGQRPVQYGALATRDGQQQLLEMNDPQFVRRPQEGQSFSG